MYCVKTFTGDRLNEKPLEAAALLQPDTSLYKVADKDKDKVAVTCVCFVPDTSRREQHAANVNRWLCGLENGQVGIFDSRDGSCKLLSSCAEPTPVLSIAAIAGGKGGGPSTPPPHFAYKALHNTDTLYITHYIIRKLCI